LGAAIDSAFEMGRHSDRTILMPSSSPNFRSWFLMALLLAAAVMIHSLGAPTGRALPGGTVIELRRITTGERAFVHSGWFSRFADRGGQPVEIGPVVLQPSRHFQPPQGTDVTFWFMASQLGETNLADWQPQVRGVAVDLRGREIGTATTELFSVADRKAIFAAHLDLDSPSDLFALRLLYLPPGQTDWQSVAEFRR
jgi:hypothetical protein